MRKIYFTLLMVLCAMPMFGQAYTYYPYQGTAYSVPDAGVTTVADLVNDKNKGQHIVYFDQANDPASLTATYASDSGATCAIAAWVPAEVNPATTFTRSAWNGTSGTDKRLSNVNGNPNCLDKSHGAWFLHTVDFTEEGTYNLVYRVRGVTPSGNHFRFEFAIYDKANTSTVVWRDSVDMLGLNYSVANSLSTDGKVQYVADGNTGASGQGTAEYVMVVKEFVVGPGQTGKYVVELDHYASGSTISQNIGIGGFTFIKKLEIPVLSVTGASKAEVTDSAAVSCNKASKIYMVQDTVSVDSVAFEAAVLGGYGKMVEVDALEEAYITFAGMDTADYVFYAVVNASKISDPAGAFELALDATSPVFVNWPLYPAVTTGDDFLVTVNEASTVYIIPTGTAKNIAAIEAAKLADAVLADSGDVTLNTTGINDSIYFVVAVDTSDNISNFSAAVRIGDLTKQKPFMDAALAIPGRIEAEKFDSGGFAVAYWDNAPMDNSGAIYRPEVFVQFGMTERNGSLISDTAAIGWINNNEWWEYTVEIAEEGYYSVKVGSSLPANAGKTFDMFIDDAKIGTVDVAKGTGWDIWFSFDGPIVKLPAGTHVLKVLITNAGFNLDYIEFTKYVDVTAPILSEVNTGVVRAYDSISAKVNEPANVYLVADTVSSVADSIVKYAEASSFNSANVLSYLTINGVPAGDYLVYAIDTFLNVSAPSEVITITDILVPVLTARGSTKAGNSVYVKSSEAGKIYLVPSATAAEKAAIEAAMIASIDVERDAWGQLATTGLDKGNQAAIYAINAFDELSTVSTLLITDNEAQAYGQIPVMGVDTVLAYKYDVMADGSWAADSGAVIGVAGGTTDGGGADNRGYALDGTNGYAAQTKWNGGWNGFRASGQWINVTISIPDSAKYALTIGSRNLNNSITLALINAMDMNEVVIDTFTMEASAFINNGTRSANASGSVLSSWFNGDSISIPKGTYILHIDVMNGLTLGAFAMQNVGEYEGGSSISNVKAVSLSVYPNPSSNGFNIDLREMNGEVSVEVISLTGAVVYTETTMGGAVFHLNAEYFANQGVYFVKVGNAVEKLIVR